MPPAFEPPLVRLLSNNPDEAPAIPDGKTKLEDREIAGVPTPLPLAKYGVCWCAKNAPPVDMGVSPYPLSSDFKS